MKTRQSIFIILCLLAAQSIYAEESTAFFSIRQNAHYPQPEKVLEGLVRAKGRQKENHFCVLGYRHPDGDEYAWAHWQEGRALILWEGSAYADHPVSLVTSRRYLRLDKDVVADKAQIKGSTFLVTQEWANAVINDCEKQGEKFVLTKPNR